MESADDASTEFAFFFGGGLAGETAAPYTVCLDDIHLDDPQFVKSKTPTADEAPVPNVLVNQTGYLAELPKLAVVKTSSKNPLKWELHKKGGAIVASGDTKPFGKDAASGDDVQIVDFSIWKTPGKDYTLWVCERRQPPVRYRQGRLQEAEVRRARLLLSDPQRHRDQDAVRRRQAVDASGRARRRRAEPGGQERPLPQGFRLRLQAGRHRRLVRRGRSGEVRRQRRHRGLDADEPVRARRRCAAPTASSATGR